MNIRTATPHDQDAIHHIHWSAFAEDERTLVSKLAIDLLMEKSTPKTISLVAEWEGDVVGHVAFSPVNIENDKTFQGFILAPLGVVLSYQKRGLGTTLVETGLQQVSSMGADILFVYGDPKYYGKFGFSADAASLYVPPYGLQYPFGWQAINFNSDEDRKSPADVVFVDALSDPALW